MHGTQAVTLIVIQLQNSAPIAELTARGLNYVSTGIAFNVREVLRCNYEKRRLQ